MLHSFKSLIAVVAVVVMCSGNASHSTLNTVLDGLFVSIEHTESLSFTLVNTERINNELMSGVQQVHFVRTPRQMVVNMESPFQGARVFYKEGEMDNKLLFVPNGFPYVNLNIDPYGSLARRNNHHTIHEVGFEYLGNLVKHAFEQAPQAFSLMSDTVMNGRICYTISIDNPSFGFVDYKVKPGENVLKIAQNLGVSEYMIVERNKGVDDYDDVEPGQVIKVPNSYAKRLWLAIEKNSMLPIVIKIWDDKGLYESYAYTDVKRNVPIAAHLLNPSL